MTVDEYNRLPYVNKSTLWELRKSPAHYQHLLTHPREDTESFRFGRAVHAAILTPAAYKRDFVVMPDGIDRRTKAGKEEYQKFMDSAAGKEVITAADAETIRAIVRAFRKNKEAVSLLKRTKREKPLFWKDDETGVPCKGRLDVITPDYVIDYKTTKDASTAAFKREALRYGYDFQAAMYMAAARANGYNPKGFIFIAQEKDPPYMVNILHASDAFLDRGAWIMRDLLTKYKECREKNEWPGYGENELILNEWEVIDDE